MIVIKKCRSKIAAKVAEDLKYPNILEYEGGAREWFNQDGI